MLIRLFAPRWSSKFSATPSPPGDASLQQYVGELYFREHNYVRAEKHLLAAGTRDAGKCLGRMGFEWYVLQNLTIRCANQRVNRRLTSLFNSLPPAYVASPWLSLI